MRAMLLLVFALLAAAVFAGSVRLSVAAPAEAPPPALFPTSDRCMGCHDGLTTQAGIDVSIGLDWQASMMAHSARDPYWQAAVSREIADHPRHRADIEDECSICHMPMSHTTAHAFGGQAVIFGHLSAGSQPTGLDALALDGVSCALCHQIEAEGLGTRESFVGGFVIDTTRPKGSRPAYGPFEVQPGLARIMRSSSGLEPARGAQVRSSELCATCHTLYTTAYGPTGEKVGVLPEQVPYLEWKHSAFRGVQSCQTCHMRVLAEPVPIASVLGPKRSGFAQHPFHGSNFLVLGMLNRHRDALGVVAGPKDLDASITGTLAHLRMHSARLEIARAQAGPEGLELEVAVVNHTGHKLPTAYPARRAWLHLKVIDARGRVAFESGRLQADGAIVGNDNDEDPRRFEPHHKRITDPHEVQIYEGILATPDGTVTTGLLSATHYVKDNRLLPDGFDKATAGPDFAVRGAAGDDPDFVGGADRVRYLVPGPLEGPLRIEAELYFQPIGFRWAANHRDYPQPESQRFVRYYDAMSRDTAVVLARAEAAVP